MCGIVGYIGRKDAAAILMNGLDKLSYRGYDSAGIAVIDDRKQIHVRKAREQQDEEDLIPIRHLGQLVVEQVGHTAVEVEECNREQAEHHPHRQGDPAIRHVKGAQLQGREQGAGYAQYGGQQVADQTGGTDGGGGDEQQERGHAVVSLLHRKEDAGQRGAGGGGEAGAGAAGEQAGKHRHHQQIG